MADVLPKLLSFEVFLSQYGNDPRYELIDGELREWNLQASMSPLRESWLGGYLLKFYGWTCSGRFPKNCLIRLPDTEATALRPDVIVLDEADLATEPLREKQPIAFALHRTALSKTRLRMFGFRRKPGFVAFVG